MDARSSSHLYQPMHSLLRLSPTYALAADAASGRLDRAAELALPPDFDRVCETFSRLGDVWGVSAEQWWRRVGRTHFLEAELPPSRLFEYIPAGQSITASDLYNAIKGYRSIREEDGCPEAVIVAIPIGDLKAINALHSRMLSTVVAGRHRFPDKPKIKLYKKGVKIDLEYMHKGIARMMKRAAQPELKLWRLEAAFYEPDDFRLENLEGPYMGGPERSAAADRRRYLTHTVKRTLATFERFAEHAARGSYPNSGNIDYQKFDYAAIGQRLSKAVA